MTTEQTVLAWGCVLALVHIFAAVRVKTRQYGTQWNMGARDEPPPPPEPLVGRLARAQANFPRGSSICRSMRSASPRCERLSS